MSSRRTRYTGGGDARGRSAPRATSHWHCANSPIGSTTLATATVRSFYISTPGHLAEFPEGATGPLPPGTLGDRMAVRVAESGGAAKVLMQLPDPVLNNSLGIVHGGVCAMALEMVASAAVNAGREVQPLHTASLRVNFIRPFHSSPESRYVGTALRVGRSSGVGEAQAIGRRRRGGHHRATHRLRLSFALASAHARGRKPAVIRRLHPAIRIPAQVADPRHLDRHHRRTRRGGLLPHARLCGPVPARLPRRLRRAESRRRRR